MGGPALPNWGGGAAGGGGGPRQGAEGGPAALKRVEPAIRGGAWGEGPR